MVRVVMKGGSPGKAREAVLSEEKLSSSDNIIFSTPFCKVLYFELTNSV